MLQIYIPSTELYDERSHKIITVKSTTINLEHSLVSLSKWESKWHKPFLSKDTEKNEEETIDYIRCMTLTQNVDPNVFLALNNANMKKVSEYIEDPMTATWFSDNNTSKKSSEIITSELIYYWMIALQIPFECQKWHLNRLLTLIRVCNIKNAPDKKMSKSDLYSRNRALNDARRKANHSNG